MPGVIISPNIKKESVRINPNGDVINPRTKEVIKPKEPEYIPTPEELAQSIAPRVVQGPTTQDNQITDPMSIQQQIDQKKAELSALEDKKKQQIELMKKQLAQLEQ